MILWAVLIPWTDRLTGWRVTPEGVNDVNTPFNAGQHHICRDIRGTHDIGGCWNLKRRVATIPPLWASICWLTHWGRVTHICVGKLTIIGSDNGLSPKRLQAIIWTNAGILLIGRLGTNFSEIQTFSLKKIRLKLSAKCCSFRLGLNVLMCLPSICTSDSCATQKK